MTTEYDNLPDKDDFHYVCPCCNGTGQRYFGETCWFCEGTKQIEIEKYNKYWKHTGAARWNN